jgi:predicted Fe-Mo cluster-binding NifX family protein
MGCWKWFNGVLKEAGIEVTDENREKIDEVIHEFIGKTSRYEHCSSDWAKTGKKIKADESERKKLIERLRAITF